MQRRRRGRYTMQGMYSPEDSLRDNYEMGQDTVSRKKGNNKITVSAPGYYASRYKKDT